MGDGSKIQLWEDLWWADQPLCSQFPVYSELSQLKTSLCHQFLGSLILSFSWNLNFHRNLLDLEIEVLERLMSSLSHLHLFPFGHDLRAWSLFSLGLFTIKSFFSILPNLIDPTPSFPIDFVWKSQAPFKVKSFAWLVTLKKVNINDMLQLRRFFKTISFDVCLFVVYGEWWNGRSYLLTLPIEFEALAQTLQLGSYGLGSS